MDTKEKYCVLVTAGCVNNQMIANKFFCTTLKGDDNCFLLLPSGQENHLPQVFYMQIGWWSSN